MVEMSVSRLNSPNLTAIIHASSFAFPSIMPSPPEPSSLHGYKIPHLHQPAVLQTLESNKNHGDILFAQITQHCKTQTDLPDKKKGLQSSM